MARPADVILSVAVGSGLGGVARYLLAGSISARWGTSFPAGTLVVNLTGCLAVGFLMRLVLDTGEFSPATRALLITGFCGGFTTFSTFAWEAAVSIEEGSMRRAALYLGSSVVLGLMAVWVGSAVARGLLITLRRGHA